MEFLVIVLFVVAIVVVNFVITRAQSRKKQAEGEAVLNGGDRPERAVKPQRTPRRNVSGATGVSPAPRTSAAAAREANARLDATQHQQVYAAIAQGHPVKAVKLYAQFTGVGVRAAGAAVENLAVHPQPYQQPRPAGTTPADATPAGATPAGATPADQTPADATPADAKPDAPAAGATPAGPETRKPADDAAGSTPKAPEKAAEPENPTADNSAAGKSAPGSGAARAADPRRESAAKPPAAPEEDEISKWVKDLRPEDF
ncbi:hypothetical protein ACIQXM_16820 [Arthrobacter sp. NPDC097144]|uniref:hypothetical protein n=1 Tax=Arthrobacter sp. NPDC097144 TaxID=3363946 RepID=UPI0037F8E246